MMGCRILLVILSLLNFAGVAPLCAAEPEAPAAAPEAEAASVAVQKQIADLDSPDAETRERATTSLMIRTDLPADALGTAYRAARSPEQRMRLTRIATHRFYAAQTARAEAPDHDSASLGISIGDLPDQRRVIRPFQCPDVKTPAFLITGTLPGFPAYAFLRPGDLIVAINSEPFTDDLVAQKFTERVKSFAPGDIVTLDVIRDSKPIAVRLRLDSLHRLQDVHQMGGRIIDMAPLQNHLQALAATAAPNPRIQLTFPDVPDANGAPGLPGVPNANGLQRNPNGDIILKNGNAQIIIRGGINGNPRINGGQIEIAP